MLSDFPWWPARSGRRVPGTAGEDAPPAAARLELWFGRAQFEDQFNTRSHSLTRPAAYAGPVPSTSPPAELSRAAFVAQLEVLVCVYAAAMQPETGQLAGRRSIMEQHSRYGGFRALAVRAGNPGPIVGFSYGFRGADGQWWHDTVVSALTAKSGKSVQTAWLADSLEIAEVHVLPDFQHHGIGKSLVLGLAAGRQERTAVLSTPDTESTARRLYRGLGFEDLLTGYQFPGAPVTYAVMGAVLPLRDSLADTRSASPSC